MNNVDKTLYIPLYAKAYVSKKAIIMHDLMAEKICEDASFDLKAKSKSKWLAYYLAMRSAFYDKWLIRGINNNQKAIILHIGCGLDSRYTRVNLKNITWYDIDFPSVIKERSKYFKEDEFYHMIEADMRLDNWKNHIAKDQDAIIILEGVSMYFNKDELLTLLSNITQHFNKVSLMMDCYSEKAARLSKYKNPINDVGVNTVYGYDDPYSLAKKTGFSFKAIHNITAQEYIDELKGIDKFIFQNIFASKFARSLYKLYEFVKL